MAIWDKLRTELDRAGRAAQGALDEGKLRLEVFRTRQLVDRAAQSLGYAVFRARTGKASPDEAVLERLTAAMQEREAELAALEDKLRDIGQPVPPRDDPASAQDSSPPASDAESTTSPGPGATTG